MRSIDGYGMECRGCGEPTHSLSGLCGICRNEALAPAERCETCGKQLTLRWREFRVVADPCQECAGNAAYIEELMAEEVPA